MFKTVFAWQLKGLDAAYVPQSDARFRAENLCNLTLVFGVTTVLTLSLFLVIGSQYAEIGLLPGISGIAALTGLFGGIYYGAVCGHLVVSRVTLLGLTTGLIILGVLATGGFPESQLSALLLMPVLTSFCVYDEKTSSRFTLVLLFAVVLMWMVPIALYLRGGGAAGTGPAKANGAFFFVIMLAMACITLSFYERANRKLVEEANAAARSKSAFLANMSHEIRTPMNGVLGMAQVLKTTRMNDKQTHYVNTIMTSGKSLLRILNDILDLSKLDAEKITLESVDFDLFEELSTAASIMRSKASEKNLDLVLDIKKDLTRFYKGDPHRLKQVLYNLMSNAIKFTEVGYISVGVSEEEIGPGRFKLKFIVQDTGVGVAPEKLKRIFNRFEQSDNSTTREYGGTGLGLAISQQIIELMDGRIDVDSEPGMGSSFSFYIEISAAEKIEPAVEMDLSFDGLQNCPVLVVDDLDVNLAVISGQLSPFGAKIITAKSAKKAVSILRRAVELNVRIPLVISDFQMPGASGLDLARFIHKDPKILTPKMIILSSADTAPHRDAFKALGVGALLEKPVLTENLIDIIKKTMSESKPNTLLVPEFHKTAQSKRPARKQKIVLIADDDPVNCDVLKQLLLREGYHAIVAESGRMACKIFNDQAFDLVFMDMSMPEMNGHEAKAEMRRIERTQKRPQTPIICFTAHAMAGDREAFLKQGFGGYLSKPIESSLLKEKLKNWERKQSTPKSRRAAS